MNRHICELPEMVQDELRFSFQNRGDVAAEDIDRAMNSRICDLMHEYDDDALVQVCYGVCMNLEWELDEPDAFIEDIPGREAVREIRRAIANGEYPLFVNGEVMGHYHINPDGELYAYIYCDCDEETYSEHCDGEGF